VRDKRGFNRTMRVTRPFDCIARGCEWNKESCKPDSGGSHGRGGMILFVAVEKDNFALSVDWMMPVYHDDTPPDKTLVSSDPLYHGLGTVAYHQTMRPSWDDEQHMNERDCDLLAGGKCFSDGSSLRAGELWKEWMARRMTDADLYELVEDEWEDWFDDKIGGRA